MRKPYNDTTYDHACGNVNREWKQMAQLAVLMRKTVNQPSWMTPEWMENQTRKFTGIYRRFLEDPLEEVEREAV